jgi:hypothetical protein
MKYVKIGLSLAFFVPAFTLFGLSGWHGDWYGGVVGGLIGVFFGLVFSGQVNGALGPVPQPEGQPRRHGTSDNPADGGDPGDAELREGISFGQHDHT